MASETQVRSEISEVSEIPIEEKCGLDMSSYEDLPNVGADCNGVSKHVDDDKEEEDANVNGNGKVDPEDLYVLVSQSDSANGDPIDSDLNAECVNKSRTLPESKVASLNNDEDGHVGQLNDEKGETVRAEDSCIAEVTDVALDGSLVKLNVDGDGILLQDQNAAAVVEYEHKLPDSKAKFEKQIEPDFGSLNKDVEGQVGQLNGESGETVCVEDNCVAEVTDVAPDGSLAKPNVDGDGVLLQDQNATAVAESENELLDSKAKTEKQIEPDFGSLNKDVEGEVGQLNDENGETVSADVAPNGSLAKPNGDGDGVLLQDQNATAVVESENKLLDSKPKIEKQIEPDFGSLNKDVEGQVGQLNDENGEIVSADVAPDVSLAKPNLDGDGVLLQDQNATAVVDSENELLDSKAKIEKQIEPDFGSLNKDVEGQVGQLNDENGETVSADVAPDGSLAKPNVDGDGVLLQDQNATVVVESENELTDSKAKIEKQIEPDFGSLNKDVEDQVLQLNDENGETVPAEDNCIDEVTDVAPDGSLVKPNRDGDGVHFQDQNATAVVESEYELLDSEAKTEKQIEPDFASDLEENQEFPTLATGVSHCGTPQPDDGMIDYEEQTNLESTAELGEVWEYQIVVSEVGEEKSEEQNNLESNAYFRESEEAPIVFSKAAESKSSMLNDGKEYANLESTSELEGSRESQVMVSEVFENRLPEVEDMTVIAEKQTQLESHQEVKESLESQISKPESDESVSYQLDNREMLEEEEKTNLRMDMKENKESQLVVTDNFSSGIEEGNEVVKLANESDLPLETEIANEHASDENKDGCPTSQLEDSISQATVLNELIDGSQNTTELNDSSENAKRLPSLACMRPEIKIGSEPVESIISCPAKDAKLEIEANNDTVGGDIVTSCNEVSSETDIGLHSIDPEGTVSTLSCFDVNVESELSNKVTDCACSQQIDVNGLDLEYHVNDSLQNGSDADMKSESEVENSSSIRGKDMPCKNAAVSQSVVLDGFVVNRGSTPNCVPEALDVQDVGDQVHGRNDSDNLMCQKTEDTERFHKVEILTSSPEGSTAALDEQNTGVEAVKRPFHFLIRIPRYEDEKFSEQIRRAQLQVDEKTQRRDAIRVDILMIKANYQQLQKNYEAARTEERAARTLVKLKRQEIDSVQSVINRIKNAISVKEIDVRIHNMEHMIQHETWPLKEEKQFIREIKQLKHLREQLSSNMGSRDEVQQALDQRDQIEEQLKVLKKELDCLKDKVSKAEATAVAAEKKCIDENKKLRELNAQYKAADVIRQEEYAHLQNLKRLLYEKNTRFRMYKGDAMAANASSGDKEALHRLCVNQVETIMELWNKNDEFRKEYLRCNTKSTLRRLRTLDGRALGPDEEPTLLPNVVDERIDRSHSTAGKSNSELPILTLEQEKKVSTVDDEETDRKSTTKVPEQMVQATITKKPGKPTLRNGSATVSGRDETEEIIEEEHKQTKEEQELARKEEELRKEEAAAKLKEQHRLEEKAKAKEALERKRRNAEKAQIRAELRAQKEAEQKEKEREKRAKKKEKKKSAAAEDPDGNNEGEAVPTSESPADATNEEPEVKDSPSTTTKRPQKPFQFTKQSKTKSIPPPLRNRGKRRMQQWIWVVLVALLVLALFLLGSMGFYSNLGHNLRMRRSGF